MLHKSSIEKVMIANCMIKAKQQLTLAGKITEDTFRISVL